MWMVIYFDDILLISTCLRTIRGTKKDPMAIFKIKDLGHVNTFVGVEFKEVEDGLEPHQRKFTRELLSRFNMIICKPVSTPLTPTQDFEDIVALP